MIKNNKGFVLTEILILSSIITGILIFMFVQFKNINRGYQYSFKYDTVEGMYLANNIINYINEDNYDTLVEKLNLTQEGYIDITNCDHEIFKKPVYCDYLFEKSEIEQIIFTKENLTTIKSNMSNLDNDFQEYIKQIKTTNEENDYRIIIKYNNGTFTTMRFNKGNSYVKEGLIVYLDGINNTGNGHSNEIQTWKDLSNHGNDATLYNNPTWDNNSLTFDGIDDYGILTNTANQAFPNGLTVETRVKILSITDFGGTTYNMFIDNVRINSGTNYGLSTYIGKEKNNFASRTAINNSFETIGTGNKVEKELDTYYTIITVYKDNYYKLYIDSEMIESKTIQGIYSESSNPFNVGKRANNNEDFSNVEFQNVLIYDRALTENEISRNYQADLARY